MENYYVKALLSEGEGYGDIPPDPPLCLSGFMDVLTACKVISFVDTLSLMIFSVYGVDSPPYLIAVSILSLALVFLMALYAFYSRNSTMLRPLQMLLVGLLALAVLNEVRHIVSSVQGIGPTGSGTIWWTLENAVLMAVLGYQLLVVTQCVRYFKLLQQRCPNASESVAFNSVTSDAHRMGPECAVFSLECSPSYLKHPPRDAVTAT